MARRIALLAMLVGGAVVTAFVPASGRAEDTLEGTYRAGPMRVEVTVGSWGDDCGPRPRTTTIPGGATIRVSRDGDQLVFHGSPTRRTDRCWSENGLVRPISKSYQSNTWRVTCKTPSEDSRRETGTYTIRATDAGDLLFRDESKYDWQLNQSRCTGDIVSTQTFSRIDTPENSDTAPGGPDCRPGAPAKLRLAPGEATIEPGGRLCFRSRVIDANRCPVPSANVTLALERPPARVGRLDGRCFVAADTAAEAEGVFRIKARAGDLTARSTVTVRTPDLSDFIARRTRSGGAIAEADPFEETGIARVAAETVVNDSAPLLPTIAALVFLGVLFLGVSIFVVRRRTSAKAPEDEPSPAEKTAEAVSRATSTGLACPICGREFRDGQLFCPSDGTALVDPADLPPGPAQGLICPTCRRGFPPDARFCPQDSDELIPYPMFLERQKHKHSGTSTTKICPKCGTRYQLDTRFCGRDGAELVLVN